MPPSHRQGPDMPARRGRLAALVTAVLLAAPVTGVGHAAAFTPVTFHVAVGGMVDDHPQVDLQSFYPRIATVHVGDRVDFDIRGLHTVSVIPNGMPVPQPIVAAPGVYPRVDDAAGQPFWWAGSARLQFNPAVALPAGHPSVNGRHYVNS